MKHIVIGDIHGRDNWRHINIKLFDKIIFLGDYVDSKILSDLIIYENLKDIITLKKTATRKSRTAAGQPRCVLLPLSPF
jgi:hypothetical protein